MAEFGGDRSLTATPTSTASAVLPVDIDELLAAAGAPAALAALASAPNPGGGRGGAGGGGGAARAAAPSTTTISTIAVQSGGTRLVIALLQSREWLQLRILESTPELTHLGATLEEALQLQRAHHDVLLKLQSKQSPVEELLRQADQLISTQGARAEVYAAMAESLGAAWRDVNHHLDTRKRVLDLNVDYHSRAEECMERMLALQLACTAVTAPILIAKLNTVADCESECESLKVRLAKIHDLRRAMLEALMLALTDGKTLLELLRGIAAEGSVDSRPDTMRVSTEFAISQVEHWLESLHDRRQALDLTFNETRSDLEQRLALAMLAAERTKIEDFITSRNEQMRSRQSQLGDSETSSQLLLHEHLKIVAEAKEVQERALKMTHATEQLAASGVTSAESAVTKSYAVLNSATEYLEMCDTLQSMLERAVAFYQAAHTALTKLDQLEIQLTTTTLSPTSQELSVLHAQIAAAAFDVSQNAVEQGLGLLDTANNNSTGAEGVKRTVEEIQKRRDILESLCTAHKEENIRLHQAINNFLEKHNNLYSWLVSRGEAFLQGHQDMGSVLAMARDFCEVHHSLIAELQVKGTEINNLLLTLPPILDQVEDVQRVEIDQKVDALHNLWLHLKQALEGRIDLSAQYLEFHEKAVQLAEQLDSLEDTLKSSATSEERQQILDERWANAQQLYGDLKNLGQSFITEAEKASDPYLDTKRAILCVETLLEHFAGRHITVAESRGVWQKSVTIEKETRLQWVNNLMESSRTVDWVSKLDAQLYPILTSGSPSATTIRQELEKKLETVLPEVRKAQNEIDDRIKNVQSLSEKLSSDEKQNEDGKDVLEKLTDLRGKLQTVLSDYQVLVQLLLSFFKNVIELEKTIDNFQLGDVVATENNVDTLLHEHDASKQTISELFKFTESESQQIIEKIRQQEPKDAAKSDEEFLKNLLADKFKTWEESCGIQRAKLEKNQQQGVFDRDLAQINYAIADLGRQLEAIRGQYGESLSSAKATSAAFDYFEKTIELLEQRIQTFVTTTKQAQSSSAEKLSDSEASRVDKELDQLQNRWSDFRGKVAESRKLIELSIQYFQLVEEAGEWFKEGSRLLVSIARRSAAVRFPESANELLAEMDTFLKPGEVKQDERIQKILELAKILYGEEKSQQVNVVLKENREMLDSFSTISRELNNLAKSLSQAEISEPQGDVEIKEIDVSDGENILSTITTTTSVQTIVTEKHTSESVLPTEKLDVNGDVEPKIEELTKEEIIIESSSVPSPNSEAENKGVIIEPVSSDETPDIKEEKEILIPAEFTEPLKDASIQEGGKFTFECKVTGKPAPEIVWEKDGISISNNPDYMTTQDGSVCTLTIEETFTEDSALYTCCATNSSGSSKTSAVLNVIESEPEETLNPPVFSVPLLDQTAREGAAHTLECLVEGLPLPTVQWYREENCIDDSPELAITYNNGQAKLRIEQVSLSDQAQYTCKANNTLGSASTSGRLSVEALKPTEGPSFSTPLSNVMARAGQKIKLECCVSGTPAPSLMWTHDGKPLKETRDVKTSYEGGRAILVISEAFPKDAGIYVLTASNPTSEVTSSCSVTVKGRLPTETSDSELASDMEPIKPSIQMALKDTEAKEGENIRLDCIIVGQPEPEVIWYHNDRPVKESADFQLLFHGDRCSLVLREALPEDAGLYRVVAINSAGEASSQCQLSVHAGEAEDVKEVAKPVETSRGPAEEVVAIAPKFTRLLADILAADGECVKLECAVEGKPKPTIRWCQNNKDVVASDRIQMTEREDGTITLIIQSVTADDRGVYTARASNSLGEAKCFSNLIVKSALSESKILELADRQVAPSFKEQFGDEVVLLGAPVKFECIVAGKPAPKVRWLFNDEPVSGKNFLVSKSGDRDVLSIQEADSNGCVSCTAENDAGKAACSAKLTVQDGFAELMSSIDGGGVSSSEEASQSFTMKRAVFMQTSSTTTSSTGTGPAQTQAHSVSTMSEQVSKKVDDEPVLQMQSEHKQEVRTVNNESAVKTESSVSVSQGGDERKETVVSTSGSTLAAAAAPAPLGPAKPTRKSTAPRFVTPLNGKIVDQGADILLEGILDGFPVPTITWTKNGVDLASLPEAASITTSWELNRVRLEMKGVSVRDAGRYTCRAVNPVGSATSTADIIVKKTVFPPVMGKRLQVQQARVGERIAMEVEVTGLPEPTITWTKDGLPLSAFPSLEVRTRTQGSCHTLVIDKATLAHAGNYAVKATNAGGESNCSADVAVWEALPEELMDQQQRDHIFRELMDFPAVQKHESFQTSKQSFLQTGGSSSSLVSREIPVSVVTTPAPAAPAAPATPAAAAAAGPAESLHISETTKTEKHFSVKVDRTSSPMLVKPVSETQAKVTTSTFSLGPDHRETNIPVESSTTVVHSREELDALSLLPKTSDLTFETQRVAEEENSAIDSSSIPTQTALQFFMTKIKEGERPPETKEPVAIPVQQKLTDKISMFERRDQDEPAACKSPELPREEVPVTKLSDKINLFEKYEGKPETREESKRFEEQIWKSYKHEPAPPAQAAAAVRSQPSPSLPEFVEPYMPGKQAKTEVQHSRVVQQETKTWSGTIQVPGKIVPSSYTQPITFKEESKTASYQKHYVSADAGPVGFGAAPDEFGLQPEPPPEMCYTPKPERATKVREDMAERVKKLQDSQKSLDPFQVPTGAVRIFPTPAPPSQPSTPQTPRAQPKTPQPQPQQQQQRPVSPPYTHTPSFLYPAERPAGPAGPSAPERRPEVPAKEEPMVRQQVPPIEDTRLKKNAETVGGGVWTTPTACAAEVPPLPIKPTSVSSFTSTSSSSTSFQKSTETSSNTFLHTSTGPILRPAAAEVPVRATSPRPAAEAISMERLWTSHRTSESEKTTAFTPVAPKPAARPVSDGYTVSRDFASEASMYSSTEQRRGPSPRPSSEGLAMEKLWAPHKPESSACSYAVTPPFVPAPEPSSEAVDKAWPQRPSVKRSWPPPKPAEVEKIVIPWAPQNEPEKVWSPEAEVRPDKFEFERREREVVQGFRPVAAPAPPARPTSQPQPQPQPAPVAAVPPPLSFAPVEPALCTARDFISSEIIETKSEQFGSSSSWCQSQSSATHEQQSSIVEEKHIKPSEAKRIWPPNKPDYDLQAPFMVKKLQQRDPPKPKPQPAPEPPLGLEPGPPPEMGFAAPPSERRRSMVESIEEDLEKSLEKEPTRVVAGGVRVIPPPQCKSVPPPAASEDQFSWKQEKSSSFMEKKSSFMRKEEFKSSSAPRPVALPAPAPAPAALEPFPFQPEPERPRAPHVPPPAKPSKFIKSELGGSDYESDLETSRISAKWRPSGSDTEEPAYRRVRPPSAPVLAAQPAPPSAFERPAPLATNTVFREQSSKQLSSSSRVSSSIASTQSRFSQRQAPAPAPAPAPVLAPLNLKPGSPPEFVQLQPERSALKSTPDSPKSKHKTVRVVVPPESGYMADTDEPHSQRAAAPRLRSPPQPLQAEQKYESRSSVFESSSCSSTSTRMSSMVSTSAVQSMTSAEALPAATVVARASSKGGHRHERRSAGAGVSAFKEVVAPVPAVAPIFAAPQQQQQQQQPPRQPLVEPAAPAAAFAAPAPAAPAAPAPVVVVPAAARPGPKRAAGPLPRSPSKFVKGEFRESDYDSDHDGPLRIPAVWRPGLEDVDGVGSAYRPVRPVLAAAAAAGAAAAGRPLGRTPTPPTEFDHPAHAGGPGGPPRPKFQPIEKQPLAAVKAKAPVRPVAQPHYPPSAAPVFKPTPVPARPPERIETLVAVPAVPAVAPGPPPQILFSSPHAPTMHETSQSMSFAEATETSRRVVSMQQTTRVIKFNESSSSSSTRRQQHQQQHHQQQALEPFPFRPEPEHSVRKTATTPPPPKPSKFVPGEFRESDYESELEAVRFRAKWAPNDSDTDEPHYRKVRPPQGQPSFQRCSSVPVETPDFSRPVYVPAAPAPAPAPATMMTATTTTSQSEFHAEQKRLQRVEEMRRRFEERKSTTTSETQTSLNTKSLRRLSAPIGYEVDLVPGPPAELAYAGPRVPPQAEYIASRHMNEMTQTFKSKAQRFVNDIMTDSRTTKVSKPEKPILKKQSSTDAKAHSQNGDESQAYREESRVAEYGTKHIDPDTGLIYFKYDFGYEFGIILPGEGKATNGKAVKRARMERALSHDEGGVDFPVLHERSGAPARGFSKTTEDIKTVPQFRPKKFTHFKSVKWEPTSESEMSEAESDANRWKRRSLPQPLTAIDIPGVDVNTPSPVSLSPSVPSLSPHTTPGPDSSASLGGSPWTSVGGKNFQPGQPAGHSGVPVNSAVDTQQQKAPVFITPLRDIAVVNGQSARFECIVQAEPPPNILWSKDGRILENSPKTQILFRNGVCRLAVANATSVDAGTYICTATNRAGTTATTATLLVPGERKTSLSNRS